MGPCVNSKGSVTLVSSDFCNAGTGVEERGYLALNIRDITKLDDLVDDCLVEWWAGVAGVSEPLAERESLVTLYSSAVLPAAVSARADLDDVRALVGATEYSRPEEIPSIDVLIRPDTVSRMLVSHPFTPERRFPIPSSETSHRRLGR